MDGSGYALVRQRHRSKRFEPNFNAAVKQAVEEENQRWNNRGPVSVTAQLVGGIRPAGETPEKSPIVQTALAVSRAMNVNEMLREGSDGFERADGCGHPRDHYRRWRRRVPAPIRWGRPLTLAIHCAGRSGPSSLAVSLAR